MTNDPTIIDLFEVTTNTDRTEGRGEVVAIGLFRSEVAARQFAKGRGVWDRPATVARVPCVHHVSGRYFRVADALDLVDESGLIAEAREAAIAKIDDVDRAALGFPPKPPPPPPSAKEDRCSHHNLRGHCFDCPG